MIVIKQVCGRCARERDLDAGKVETIASQAPQGGWRKLFGDLDDVRWFCPECIRVVRDWAVSGHDD